MKTVDLVRFSTALGLMTVPAAVSGARIVSDPAPIVSAFNETCRRGFPNLETIRRQAESVGWVRRSIRLVGEPSDSRSRSVAMPEVFGKGDMILFLSAPNALDSKSSCTIAVSGEKMLDVSTLAQAVSAALGGAEATVAKIGSAEQTIWRLKPGIEVRASISKSGRTRTANLVVMTS